MSRSTVTVRSAACADAAVLSGLVPLPLPLPLPLLLLLLCCSRGKLP